MSGMFNIGGAPVTVNQAGADAGYHSLGDFLLNVPNPNHDTGTQVTGIFVSLAVTVRGGQNFIADELKVNGQTAAEQQQYTQGLWINGGLTGNYYRRASGGREEAASWTVTGLTPGAFYEVSSTWLAYSTLSTKARYFIYDGDSVEPNQRRPDVLAGQFSGCRSRLEAAGHCSGDRNHDDREAVCPGQ